MTNLSSALTLLTAMITPAVLIVASGSLILNTSYRLSRVLERTRAIYEQFEADSEFLLSNSMHKRKINMQLLQLSFIIKRARILQFTLSYLLVALGVFVLTSISIGIISLVGLAYAWLPTTLAMIGIFILFMCCSLLILESSIAWRAVRQEMEYAMQTRVDLLT